MTRLRAVAAAAALGAVLATTPMSPARAEPPAGAAVNRYYYTVTASYQGSPENLWEIASRFLGDPARAGEILDLNSGRVQPDGERLSDPSRLSAGWHLVLPWDAVGPDLRQGPVPAGDGGGTSCARQENLPPVANWGQTLLTPSQVWKTTNGSGVKVAVIASGVDGSAPELGGRVNAGADLTGGTGRGDLGCRAGTGLAGIIAGEDGQDGASYGVAPGARIVPIKAGVKLTPALTATGIGVAVSAGARVILIGSAIDARDPAVVGAVSDAISRDVVVVLPATSTADPAGGLIRAGAAGQDKQPAGEHLGGSADVLAPGVRVATIGRVGSGDEYAAAWAAGTAALIRSAYPGMHAAEVTERLVATAADGLVSPVAAVNTPLPSATANATPASAASGMDTLSKALTWAAVILAILLLLPYLLQRPVRMVNQAMTRRRERQQAQATLARLTTGADDEFWDAPTAAR
ncbi:S8 family serine peptidase [Actinoplanes sp. G11-F43]|uniref:S8 family serine peptidase n=1 Tax=Actinoplanes sp. G11-F43 TaxID=3424130 RepID=UPI003D34125E